MTEKRNLHIFIAEDDSDDAQIVGDSFRNNAAFAKVSVFPNGTLLLDKLREGLLPDVILTDINMPLLNGIELLRIINSDEKFRDIPLLMYSTTINPVFRTQCVDLGCKGFLVKPYTIDEFDDLPLKLLDSI